ncbi:hypothetical protein [Corynebacterium sp.]|uniref:hypothetical protein n=1 Tax=Corynebacterium sp. TaxID=1720 RepID=UPI0025B82E4B|nr:hypothetical protein [Corynebacterium sp.]
MRHRKSVLAGLCMTGLAVTSCTIGEVGEVGDTTESTTSTHVVTSTAQASASTEVQLQELVDAAVATFGGGAALAVADGAVVSAGEVGGAPVAWSTIKVPIAVAALREDPALGPLVGQAIQASDNAAAEQLWASLGEPTRAAAAVESVLAEAGTPVEVSHEHTRPGFSSFGQTAWALDTQARFAAQLPCLTGAGEVLADMGMIEQRYGLGQLEGARFKGGWGPEPDGRYTVRQFGLVPGAAEGAGEVAVSLWVMPASGTYEDAQAMSNLLATGLGPVLGSVSANACG